MTELDTVFALDREDANAVLSYQTAVLELMSRGAPLTVMLDRITAGLEQLLPGSSCSLLLLDRASGTLRHGSAPSLPPSYLAAIDGLRPAVDAGSCGTAAYLGRAVVVGDVTADERWTAYRAAAAQAGLRACWSTPVVGPSADVIGTFAVYHGDVHEPNQREQGIVDRLTYLASVAIEHAAVFGALTMSEERLRRAFSDSAVAMALVDTDGRLTRVNDALRSLSPHADAGASLASLVIPADRGNVETALRGVVVDKRRSAQCEARIGPATVSMTMSLVRGAGAEPLQVSVNLLDVTERIAAQRERRARREADLARRSAESETRAKSAFLSALSHEMRTPLQAITGFAELLGTLDLDETRRREGLEHIRTGAAHLLALVDDTLDLSRIEADALPLRVEAMAVHPVVTDVVEFLAPIAREHRVCLHVDTACGHVRGDRRRLHQVLINLVSNAIRYSGPDATVRVGAESIDDRMLITITDNGPGIDPAVRTRLFEPFARTEHDADSGVGLGLLLARGLAEAMGGTVRLEDVVPSGTKAVVDLPAADEDVCSTHNIR